MTDTRGQEQASQYPPRVHPIRIPHGEKVALQWVQKDGAIHEQWFTEAEFAEKMTKREKFAGMAMMGLLTDVYSSIKGHEMIKILEKQAGFEETGATRFTEQVARNAFAYADAMLREAGK